MFKNMKSLVVAALALIVTLVSSLSGCVGAPTDEWKEGPATPTPYLDNAPAPTPGINFFTVHEDKGEDEDEPAYWARFFGTSAAGDVVPASGVQINGDFSFEYRSCKYYTAATCGAGLVIKGSIKIPRIWSYDTGDDAYTSKFTSAMYYPNGWFVGEIKDWDPDAEKYQGMVVIGWILDDPDLSDEDWTSDNPAAQLNLFFGVLYYGLLEEIKTDDPNDAEEYLTALGQIALPRTK